MGVVSFVLTQMNVEAVMSRFLRGGLVTLGGMEVMRETGGLGLAVFSVILSACLAYYAGAMSRKRVLS